MLGLINLFLNKYAIRYQRRRSIMFFNNFSPSINDKFLDLGKSDGSLSKFMMSSFDDMYLADIDPINLQTASKLYGFKTIKIKTDGLLPFKDKEFDIIFSNSAIEHMTVEREKLQSISYEEFKSTALKHQQCFANEIRRVGKTYFVQTPAPLFPLESHTWFPFLFFLPRKYLILLLSLTNKFWIKKTIPDWYPISYKRFKQLFPEAKIIKEKSFFITKSYIAIYNTNR